MTNKKKIAKPAFSLENAGFVVMKNPYLIHFFQQGHIMRNRG